MKQQARPAKVQPVPLAQLPSMRRLFAKPGNVAFTEIFKDHPGAGADHPAVAAGNSRIFDDNVILTGAADGGLSLGKQKQPLPGSLSRQNQDKMGSVYFLGHVESILFTPLE